MTETMLERMAKAIATPDLKWRGRWADAKRAELAAAARRPMASISDPAVPATLSWDGEDWTLANWTIDCAGEPVSFSLVMRALANLMLAEALEREVGDTEVVFENTRMGAARWTQAPSPPEQP